MNHQDRMQSFCSKFCAKCKERAIIIASPEEGSNICSKCGFKYEQSNNYIQPSLMMVPPAVCITCKKSTLLEEPNSWLVCTTCGTTMKAGGQAFSTTTTSQQLPKQASQINNNQEQHETPVLPWINSTHPINFNSSNHNPCRNRTNGNINTCNYNTNSNNKNNSNDTYNNNNNNKNKRNSSPQDSCKPKPFAGIAMKTGASICRTTYKYNSVRAIKIEKFQKNIERKAKILYIVIKSHKSELIKDLDEAMCHQVLRMYLIKQPHLQFHPAKTIYEELNKPFLIHCLQYCLAKRNELNMRSLPTKKVTKIEESTSKPAAKKIQRCGACKKRLGVLGGTKCNCGGSFCAKHRYSYTHDCSFDYKAKGKELLIQQNPVVKASKIQHL